MSKFTPNKSEAMNREIFKIILMGLMVLDHIDYFISPYLADVFHILTRVVAVGFAYLVVEGMYYTYSRRTYLIRLTSWGLLMSLGNLLMNLFVLRKQYSMSILGDNIFLTLMLGASVVWLWDNQNNDLRKNRILKILSIVLALISLLPILEGSTLIVPFMLVTQMTHENVKKRNWGYIILMVIIVTIELPQALMIPNANSIVLFDSVAMNASEMFFILIIPMLHFYNGEISNYNKKLKYLFYIFYPLHLWLIHLIANYG